MTEDYNRDDASDFDGHNPVHCRWLRPTRGLVYDDPELDSFTEMASGGSQQTNASTLAFEIPLPFELAPATDACRKDRGNIYY